MTDDIAKRTDTVSDGTVNNFPFSGPVSQWMRTFWFPWTDFINPTGQGQVGLFNVIHEMEREIVASVARYGKQLGHINEALNVVISLVVSQADSSRLGPDERRALDVLSNMFKEIAKARGEHVAPTEKDLDIFLGDVRDLKNQDPETYGKLIRRLREFAETERPE